MTIRELLQTKREAILALAARYGASNIRIFGAAVRGDDRPGTDIDFVVTLEPSRNLLDYVALIQALEELLGQPVRVATEEGLHENASDYLLQEAIPL